MADFIETPRFPGCPSYGFMSSPDYKVTVVATAGGFERRNRNWSRPLTSISVTVGPRREADIKELLDFWHVVGGIATGFRVKDWTDYQATDEPLVAIGGGNYQLTKRYDVGASQTQDREIYKPVPGTIVLSGGGSLDTTTGVVTGGAGGTWSGEFDLPMRFSSDFPVAVVNLRIQTVTFTLVELRIRQEST